MSPAMQVKLLRVLQEGEVMRVGGGSIVHVDVRIVAATNESLEQMVEEGSFRRDLYYRLNALTVAVPPLRERGEDILLLLEHFRRQLGGEFRLSQAVRDYLLSYSWPGNIRELRNAAEYFNYTGSQVIEMGDLPPTMAGAGGQRRRADSPSSGTVGGEHAEADTGWREKAREFVFRELCLAEERGEAAGREKILEAARREHMPLSQKEVRDILRELSLAGLAKVGRGRGGSRVTPAGWERWREGSR